MLLCRNGEEIVNFQYLRVVAFVNSLRYNKHVITTIVCILL